MSFIVKIKKQLALYELTVDLETEAGILAVIGGSGSGKSMTLKCIAGIEKPDEGYIELDGVVLYDSAKGINLPPQKRRVGYLFQNYALFPHMSVKNNIIYGLKAHKMDENEINARLKEVLKMLELEGLEDRKPKELSGGMRQRVAIARALANRPDVLLMDEPFGALDAHTRILLQRELLRIWQHHKTTILFVTHGVDEAVYLADRVVVMSARPGTVRAVVPVDIPRPRHRGDPEYARLTASILEMLDTSAGTGRDERKNDAGGCPCR